MGKFRRFEVTVFRKVRRDPPEGFVHRAAFWLLVFYLGLSVPGFLPGSAGTFFGVLAEIAFYLLLAVCVPLLWRFVFTQLLWKVRNRLVVTYLLMGLTPVVLFVTLALLLLYVFSGQFAIFAATSVVGDELAKVSSMNRSLTVHMAHVFEQDPRLHTVPVPPEASRPSQQEYAGMTVAVYEDGKPVTLAPAEWNAGMKPTVPGWFHGSFSSLTFDHGQLWLRAADEQTMGSHRTVVISSVPLEKENVEAIARGLGRVSIFPSLDFGAGMPNGGSTTNVEVAPPRKEPVHVEMGRQDFERARKNAIVGGELPPPQHFYDVPVRFGAPLTAVDWATGSSVATAADVTSRPSLLYNRLFITSLTVANMIRDLLIGIAVAFGVLELLAFLAAVRLNRTITKSVHDLYEATLAIDGGNLGHRIQVKRRDQLGALSRSFNSMATSLERLLVEQREKERLQNELAIAQEVQANLFPRGKIALPMLELHGVCLPARTVSGDYYDFLLFGDTGLGMALGDISGKGISAALLMATLHSAVRAYRFAGEELVMEGTTAMVSPRTRRVGEHEVECAELFEEPARILSLLNRHLYRSTQPEKYATLFLAHYDGLSRRLVYANGGHLPPMLLRADDTVTKLDRGGSVVGLLDELSWEQGTEHLDPGDILIAYSDGVTEPENDFGEFGEERLLDVVRRHKHLSLEAISEQVISTLRTWIGAQEQPDDVTLVLARQR
ncbi:MAG TPA: SpoIIE family protein phosphatase [Acidobacteriaceae bacterium]|jgi:sigma-B regulation protein RsbU (phosphoserine phosphatase)|nr:SpoIIE family protein phosphatase [Acidobacteriaceae bacterium]